MNIRVTDSGNGIAEYWPGHIHNPGLLQTWASPLYIVYGLEKSKNINSDRWAHSFLKIC